MYISVDDVSREALWSRCGTVPRMGDFSFRIWFFIAIGLAAGASDIGPDHALWSLGLGLGAFGAVLMAARSAA